MATAVPTPTSDFAARHEDSGDREPSRIRAGAGQQPCLCPTASIDRGPFARIVLAAASALLFFATGCGATDDQLRTRAAFDFKCNASQVQIVEIDDQTRGVRACDQQGTYVERCDYPIGTLNRHCTWILNTNSSSSH
jgi:hypothetical protein